MNLSDSLSWEMGDADELLLSHTLFRDGRTVLPGWQWGWQRVSRTGC